MTNDPSVAIAPDQIQAAVVLHPLPGLRVRYEVELEQIQVIHPQASQGTLDVPLQGSGILGAGLGEEEDFTPVTPSHCSADTFLAAAVAGGGVDPVDAAVQSEAHQPLRFLIGEALNGNAAEPYFGETHAGCTELDSLHDDGL